MFDGFTFKIHAFNALFVSQTRVIQSQEIQMNILKVACNGIFIA